jgi:magnesium-transporting ATPase (P-type)
MTVKEVYLTPDVKPKLILVKRMLTAMVLNSDVSEKKRNWHGDSTEIALVDYALTKKE